MIIERKIELLTAFEKGKTVEIYHKPDGKWYKVNHDIWISKMALIELSLLRIMLSR